MKYNFYPFDYKNFLIVRGNKSVIKTKGYPIPEDIGLESKYLKQMREGHFCGYVAMPKWKIPWQWWSHYDADGLQYLSIHGGITYCHTESRFWITGCLLKILLHASNNIEKFILNRIKDKKRKNRTLFFKDDFPVMPNSMKVSIFFMRFINPFIERILGDLVVFGFDCAHAGDEEDERFGDHQVVMLLTEQMERQLLDFAKVYRKWFNSSRDERMAIMDKIRLGEKFNTGLGLGAMLDMFSGGKDFGKASKNKEVREIRRMWRARKIERKKNERVKKQRKG